MGSEEVRECVGSEEVWGSSEKVRECVGSEDVRCGE